MPRCHSCRTPIEWASTANGKHMPLEERPGGNVIVTRDLLGEDPVAHVVDDGAGTHVSHFATCPHGEQWRRRS